MEDLNNSSRPGIKGGQEHVAILTLLKEKVLPLLHHRGYPYAGILFNQKLQSIRLHYSGGNEKDALKPDAMICERYIPFEEMAKSSKGEFILIEAGNYNPDKWNEYPVIHIGVNNRRVTPVMSVTTDFQAQTLKAITEIMANEFEYDLGKRNINEYRDLAAFAISGVGLTNEQVNSLYLRDFSEDETGYYVQVNEYGKLIKLKISSYIHGIIQAYLEARKLEDEHLTSESLFYAPLRGETIKRRGIQRRIKRIFDKNLYTSPNKK